MSKIITTKLENICVKKKGSLISGPFGSNISSKFFVEEGVPVIRGNNLYLSYEKFNDDGFVYVTKKKADELNCYAYREDLIFTAAGTIGQVGLIPNDSKYEEYVISNKQIRARIDQSIVDVKYAYYWFCSPWMQKCLMNNNKGSTVPLLTLGEVRDLQISYPESLDEQRRIVECIEYISKKIEINNKINDNLANQALLIFRYMFPNIAAGAKHVSDYISPKRGKALLSKDALPGAVPVVAGGLEPATYHNQANTIAPVITISGSGANAGYVNIWQSPVWSSDSSFIDKGMTDDVYFWYAFLKYRQNDIFTLQAGSAQPHIYPKHIEALSIAELDKKAVSAYTRKVAPLYMSIGKNIEECRKLGGLRDFLLPLLMNGQASIFD